MAATRRLLVLGLVVALAGCAPVLAAKEAGGTGFTNRPVLLAPAAPVAAGADTVTVLRSGEPTFTELRRLIDGAHASVDVEVYEFGRADLVEALVAARGRGATVTVIDDRSELATAATALRLRAAGIDVVDYPVRARMIDHVKLLVVDGAAAVVGGINWGSRSARNHDFDLELRGPAVPNLERVFRRDLVTSGRQEVVPAALVDPALLVGTTLPGADILPMVLAIIGGARHSLDVAMYTLTSGAAVAAMEAALARGVAVRVLLDPSERPSDAAAASLRAHGVAVRLYAGAGEKLHAKAAMADGHSAILGSANWTVSGFEHNHELDVALPDCPAVVTSLEQQFAGDWAASA